MCSFYENCIHALSRRPGLEPGPIPTGSGLMHRGHWHFAHHDGGGLSGTTAVDEADSLLNQRLE